MPTYAKIADKPRVLRNLTGLTVEAFTKLAASFERAYEAHLEEQDRQREQPRRRRRGGGRKSAIPTIEDKLLFILFYFKVYPLQEVQGLFFGMSRPQANFWIHRPAPILNRALGYEMQLPAREPADLEQVLEACPGLEFIIDGTERPIRRPKDPQRQRRYYSGKKKRHTVKNLVITDKRTRKIKGLSPTVEGKMHDKRLADESGFRFPAGSKLWKDVGFQGYEPEGVETFQPKKKPRGGELTAEERAQNRDVSRVRIRVEHAIGGTKVFHIVRDVYRNRRRHFEDLVMETACGLHNFRLDYPLTA